MEFFSREFTFTINGLALAGLAVFAVISLFTIFFYINHLLSRIRNLERPKYGFLGKPLYNMVAMAVMIAGLGFFSYSFTKQQNFEIQAEKVITAELDIKVMQQGTQSSTISVKAIPRVDGTPWGSSDSNKFDIYWNIIGPDTKDKFEFTRSLAQPSGYTMLLKNGSYEFKTVIVFQGRSYNFSKKISF